MHRKHWLRLITFYLTLTLLGTFPLLAAGAQEPVAQADPTPITTITVNSTADYTADGKSKTCLTATPCTLRRAINQAYSLGAAARPVLIRFDIPNSEASPGNFWKIILQGTSLDDLRELNGQTILDGGTQPRGRTTGPRIVINGAGNHNYGFILRNGNNIVRGVAMQSFKTAHISVASNDNNVENSWFGLSDDGTLLSAGDALTTEGGGGVALAGGVLRNSVRGNVFAGFFGAPVAIRGEGNVFQANKVGTRADGTVPLPAQFSQHPCLSGAWAGGSGITVEGDGNLIGGPAAANGNLFAGLFLDIFAASTQRPAMDIDGTNHTIQNNIIGLDINGKVIGVCGRGLDLGGAPKNLRVIGNTLVETNLSAILMNGALINGNTLRGNVIKRLNAWPPAQGMNNFPEDAIAYGGTVPALLRNFRPARILSVNGLSVNGASEAGSPCPACTVEIFLDDRDTVTETLRSLAVTTADAGGNWSATLAEPLPAGYGLRTISTVPDTFTIPGLATGTSSNLSALQAARAYKADLPLIIRRRR